MQTQYREDEAQQFVQTWAGRWGDDVALRVYTSRLLGQNPALVLHGGGNTSVKTTAREHTGDVVDVLYVKGSGWDLAQIEPAGFPACRLSPLRALCALDTLSDDDMVAALRSQMLNPSSPTPSVEALLHAFLPGKFVDHTHADAVLTLQDQPNARAIAQEVWGDAFRFIPYVMPGFALGRRVVELAGDLTGVHGLILEQHGIFTWGDTARESYDRMIAGVDAAETWFARHRTARSTLPGMSTGVPAATTPPTITVVSPRTESQIARAQREVAIRLRGALAAAGHGRFLMSWRTDKSIMALLGHSSAQDITARGTVTPDHVIRTKPRPMWLSLAWGHDGHVDTAALDAACTHALDEYAAWYDDYFARGRNARSVDAHGATLTKLDSAPRVVFVPGLGALTVGRTLADAQVAGDIIARSAQVMLDAESVGRFHPVSELDLFDVEYWSLEQAKLAQSRASGALTGQVAYVTGAAGGIGFATAEHLLALGAHVFVSDRDASGITDAIGLLAKKAGRRVAGGVCDVTSVASVTESVHAAVHTFGGLDVLVSNAGTAPQGLLHTDAGDAALSESLEINLLGHQRVAKVVTDVLVAQKTGGCLLFNASKSAMNQGPDFGPYAVPKAALLSLMRQYAVDLGAHGIRANAVNADRIRTDLFGGGVLEARAHARGVSPDAYFRQNLLQRETTAADVAAAFGWLAQAAATTGCVITVDGGNAAAFVR